MLLRFLGPKYKHVKSNKDVTVTLRSLLLRQSAGGVLALSGASDKPFKGR